VLLFTASQRYKVFRRLISRHKFERLTEGFTGRSLSDSHAIQSVEEWFFGDTLVMMLLLRPSEGRESRANLYTGNLHPLLKASSSSSDFFSETGVELFAANLT
jgi:hypothetical protein